MARKKATDIINEVGAQSKSLAQAFDFKQIEVKMLVDHPKNNEDISYTEDLEQSIKELGFTDPIEVTDFGVQDGKYMITSGHRRRAAAVKCGIKIVPCIIRHFKSEQEVYNAVLFGNSQRDSGKGDILLLAKRYKMHESYLDEIGFKGSKREEIAKRLGLSPQQADRYAAMNRIDLAAWDMIRAEKIGMSSVMPLASMTVEQQSKAIEYFNKYLESAEHISRETAKMIIEGVRAEKAFDEISTEKEPVRNLDYPDYSNVDMNDTQEETKEEQPRNRNDEIRPDNEPEYEDERKREDRSQEQDEPTPEEPEISEEEKNGAELLKICEKISKFSEKVFDYPNASEAQIALNVFCETCRNIIDDIYSLSEQGLLGEALVNEAIENIRDIAENYI
ncbi:MAG TPA: plasmid partitioning protein [Ruminococcus sp.]|nr:plasmid partitioning protein [Ruminococcus sp.]